MCFRRQNIHQKDPNMANFNLKNLEMKQNRAKRVQNKTKNAHRCKFKMKMGQQKEWNQIKTQQIHCGKEL